MIILDSKAFMNGDFIGQESFIDYDTGTVVVGSAHKYVNGPPTKPTEPPKEMSDTTIGWIVSFVVGGLVLWLHHKCIYYNGWVHVRNMRKPWIVDV